MTLTQQLQKQILILESSIQSLQKLNVPTIDLQIQKLRLKEKMKQRIRK